MSIRIARHEEDGTIRFETYDTRQVDEVPGTLALRFDAELFTLKQHALDLGVKRWTEAVWRIRKFRAEAVDKLAELARELGIEEDLPADATPDQVAERVDAVDRFNLAYADWQSEHPSFFLAEKVALWAAVNLGGGRMTLLQVLELPPTDVSEEDDELPEFVPDGDPAEVVEAGKA